MLPLAASVNSRGEVLSVAAGKYVLVGEMKLFSFLSFHLAARVLPPLTLSRDE